jgi:hypothetical protein
MKRSSSPSPADRPYPHRRIHFIFSLCVLSVVLAHRLLPQGVGISETSITPSPSAILELRSSVRGLLTPRMTTAERNAVASPATGLLIFNTTTNEFNVYNGSAWVSYFSFASVTSGGVPYFNSSSSMASSSVLAANAVVIGGGAGAAPSTIGAGTSTTVLHGNAAGAPSYGAVSLTADVYRKSSGRKFEQRKRRFINNILARRCHMVRSKDHIGSNADLHSEWHIYSRNRNGQLSGDLCRRRRCRR